jgi:tetratricopeptide (TPR) repeat protein
VVALVLAGIGVVAARGHFPGECSGTEVTNTAGRLSCSSSNNRFTWWGEAWRVFKADPAGGKGAGTFEIARRPVRHNALVTTEPHNIAAQLLAETGVFGLLFGLAAAAAALAAAWTAVRRLEGPERAAAVALACAVPAYLVHAFVDIDWDYVAVTAPVLLVLGALIGASSSGAARPRSWLVSAAGLLAIAGAAYSLTAPWLSDRRVSDAYAALGRGDTAAAVAAARSAHDLDPFSIEPFRAWALADTEARRKQAALLVYANEVRAQPENSDTWYDIGAFEFNALHDPCNAYDALNHAYTLDPWSPTNVKGGLLDRARAVRNSGTC